MLDVHSLQVLNLTKKSYDLMPELNYVVYLKKKLLCTYTGACIIP